MKTELKIDFTGGAVGYRLRQGEGRNQALPKAVGMAKGGNPHVVDATAGMGRDAFLLASLGARVTLIERNPTVHAALARALDGARAAGGEYAAVAARMSLRQGDAKTLLSALDPDVVLVDPMHPPRTKSALVKQEMRVLRDIVGTDPDALELMQAALASGARRVVLKWPQRAAPMDGLRKPSHQIAGKTVRYDVFVINDPPENPDITAM